MEGSATTAVVMGVIVMAPLSEPGYATARKAFEIEPRFPGPETFPITHSLKGLFGVTQVSESYVAPSMYNWSSGIAKAFERQNPKHETQNKVSSNSFFTFIFSWGD